MFKRKKKEVSELQLILQQLQNLNADSLKLRQKQRAIDDKMADIRNSIQKWLNEN